MKHILMHIQDANKKINASHRLGISSLIDKALFLDRLEVPKLAGEGKKHQI